MRYVIVDDEQNAGNLLQMLLQDYEQYDAASDQISLFCNPTEALQNLLLHPADFLFLDIEMPELNGMHLAEQLQAKCTQPPIIIFVTAYPQYSLDAWNTNANGYILKPYEPEQIYAVLDRNMDFRKYLKQAEMTEQVAESTTTWIQCFPTFEVFVQGTPIQFHSSRAKELLAFLVHNQGNWTSVEKIAFHLMEYADADSSKNYIRTLVHRLKKTLKNYALEDILQSGYGKLRVNTELFSCDYYEYLSGNTSYYHGEYLSDYSWAEDTNGYMWQAKKFL